MFSRRVSTLPYSVIRLDSKNIKRLKPYPLRTAAMHSLGEYIRSLCSLPDTQEARGFVKQEWLPCLPADLRGELYDELLNEKLTSRHRHHTWLSLFYLFFDAATVQALQFEEFIGSHVTHTAFLYALTFPGGFPCLTKGPRIFVNTW